MVTMASASSAASAGEVGPARAARDQVVGLGLAAIPHRDGKAGVEIAAGHAVAHASQSDERDLRHAISPRRRSAAGAVPKARCASVAAMNSSRSPSSTPDGVGGLHAGAQVLHHLIGLQHVGADLVAPADVGLGGLIGGGLRLALLQLDLVEPRAQHVPGLRLVLVLRAAGLTDHRDAGRDMGQPHRGFGLVDVLAAGAAGAHGVDAHVALVDVDLDRVVDHREDRHRRRTRCAGARWNRTARSAPAGARRPRSSASHRRCGP